MKFFYLFIIFGVLSCQPKENKPELDYVKIDIYPMQYHIPSSITIDFKSRIVTFSDLSQLQIIPEDCGFISDKLEPNVEFNLLHLNEEEFNELKKIINMNFLNSVRQLNYSEFYDEGTMFRISISNNDKIYATGKFLKFEQSLDKRKIFEVLKIIKKHTNSEFNKKYINDISRYLY